MSAVPTTRTYHFGPLDRTGWVLGLDGAQCGAIAVGIVAGGALLNGGAPPVLALGPVLAGVAFAFATTGRRPLHEVAPAAAAFASARLLGQTRWLADLPPAAASPQRARQRPALPPFLADVELVDAGPVAWAPLTATAGVGVVVDHRDRTVSASARVRGREFSLLERGDQERLIQLWGDALAGFCTERTAVGRIRVTEWAAPSGVADQERYLAIAGATSSGTDPHRSYDALLDAAGAFATAHEVFVTVTVDLRRLHRRPGARRAAMATATDVVLEEIRLLSRRLEAAGLTPDAPLSVDTTAELLRLRCDPSVAGRLEARRRSLAALAGVVSPYNAGPLATDVSWSALRVDGSVHRTYWVAEWPRLDVGPNWLEPLLLRAGGVRTFALHYEPVPPSHARRRVDRDATRLAADEEQRSRSGFRIGARHRRAEQAVLEREAELVAGYAELEYAGFVTVTAPDEQTLARSCAEHEQVAAQAGLELRALDGRQDVAFVCSLPLGRGVAPRRWA